MKTTTAIKERLYSLDVLRGLDMMLLTIFAPLFGAFNASWKLPDCVMHQFTHPWGGFTLYDIIMPLFIFMCGAAVPFAMGRRLDENGRPTPAFWKHLAWRVVMLWVLGMICQGRLVTLDPHKICLYTNTLQTIAAGYVIASLALLLKNRRVRFALPFVLAGVYGLLMHFGGDYSVKGNFAMKVEQAILNVIQLAPHDTNQYTWYVTTLMFGAMTLWGMQATEILRGEGTQWRKAGILAGYGAGLLALGWILVIWVPMIKQIFTVSFTLQAVGWSMLALAALYVLTDILKFRRGLGLVVIFGQNALTVYMCCNLLMWKCWRPFSEWALSGLPYWLGPNTKAMPFLYGLGTAVCMCLCAVIRHRLRQAKAANQ